LESPSFLPSLVGSQAFVFEGLLSGAGAVTLPVALMESHVTHLPNTNNKVVGHNHLLHQQQHT
jgi:hypothetical protein